MTHQQTDAIITRMSSKIDQLMHENRRMSQIFNTDTNKYSDSGSIRTESSTAMKLRSNPNFFKTTWNRTASTPGKSKSYPVDLEFHTFGPELGESRVYKRTFRNKAWMENLDSRLSFRSSVRENTIASTSSKFTALSEISNISAYTLPIPQKQIYNQIHYTRNDPAADLFIVWGLKKMHNIEYRDKPDYILLEVMPVFLRFLATSKHKFELPIMRTTHEVFLHPAKMLEITWFFLRSFIAVNIVAPAVALEILRNNIVKLSVSAPLFIPA